MERTTSSTAAGAWPDGESALAETGDAELTRLKERLGFYETFDQLIQDNVSRAGELLRHAASVRETAEHDLVASKREMEQQRSVERQEFRATLSGLLDDVTSMQVQIERLARRVSNALDEIEVMLPAGGDVGQLAAATSPVAGAEPTPTEEPVGLSLDPTPDEIGPPEPQESEAELRGLVTDEPKDDIEQAVAAAQAAEAPIDTVEEFVAGSAPLIEQTEDVVVSATGQTDVEPPTPQEIDDVVLEPSAHSEPRVTESEASEPVVGDGVVSEPLAAAAGDSAIDSAPELPDEAPPVTPEEILSEPVLATVPSEESEPPRLSWISQDVRPFSVEGIGSGVRHPGTTESRTPEPSPQPESVSSPSPSPDVSGTATAVLVHGVPRATTALSLKRFLEGLPQVSGVEPREYAEGILRLHVMCERPLQIDDLRGWPDGTGMEPVHVRDDLIEVRLPH